MISLLPREKASIYQNYGLKVADAVRIGTGVMSATMAVHTNRGRLFLKRYKFSLDLNPSTEISRIAYAHAAQDFLCERGFPVPRLLRNRNGGTLTVEGGDIYAISEFVDGHDYNAVKPAGALRCAGKMLGRIHGELRGFQPPVAREWTSMKDEVVNTLRQRLERIRIAASETDAYPVSANRIDAWMAEVEGLTPRLPAANRGGWIIHGDYRAQNLKFDSEGKVKSVLDLDAVRPANRLYDLAYALVFFPAVYQNTPLTSRQKSIFLDAYESVCPLTEEERNTLPAHLELAYLRGMTLWLRLHDSEGMRERVRPWIRGYLSSVDTATRVQRGV